jgi:hypothetical protein
VQRKAIPPAQSSVRPRRWALIFLTLLFGLSFAIVGLTFKWLAPFVDSSNGRVGLCDDSALAPD